MTFSLLNDDVSVGAYCNPLTPISTQCEKKRENAATAKQVTDVKDPIWRQHSNCSGSGRESVCNSLEGNKKKMVMIVDCVNKNGTTDFCCEAQHGCSGPHRPDSPASISPLIQKLAKRWSMGGAESG